MSKKIYDSDIDKENMYKVLKDFPKQIKDAYELGSNITPRTFTRLLITGMGGSALPGEILKSYLFNGELPVDVNKGYSVPEYVDKDTLVFL